MEESAIFIREKDRRLISQNLINSIQNKKLDPVIEEVYSNFLNEREPIGIPTDISEKMEMFINAVDRLKNC